MDEQEDKLASAVVPESYQPYPRVAINVSGVKFETRLPTLQRFPNTLLGDPERRQRYYDAALDEYVFETDRDCFDAILYYYQSKGTLLRPPNVSMRLFMNEIKFYELGELAVDKFLESEGYPKKTVDLAPTNEFQKKVWLFVENPGSSLGAKIYAWVSLLITVISTGAFCLNTLPANKHYRLLNETHKLGDYTVLEDIIPKFDDPLSVTETLCIVWFTIELLIRFWASPNTTRKFFTKFPNVIDLCSIIPFILDVGLIAFAQAESSHLMKGKAFATLKAFRFLRVLIIFKTSGHSDIFKTLVESVKRSGVDIFLSFFVMSLGVVVFSCLMYFVEGKLEGSEFHSIPGAFWWGVITLTTVGYGDQVPVGISGKIVASICAITGAFTAAFFVPAIAANFRAVMNRVERYYEADEEQE